MTEKIFKKLLFFVYTNSHLKDEIATIKKEGDYVENEIWMFHNFETILELFSMFLLLIKSAEEFLLTALLS